MFAAICATLTAACAAVILVVNIRTERKIDEYLAAHKAEGIRAQAVTAGAMSRILARHQQRAQQNPEPPTTTQEGNR